MEYQTFFLLTGCLCAFITVLLTFTTISINRLMLDDVRQTLACPRCKTDLKHKKKIKAKQEKLDLKREKERQKKRAKHIKERLNG
jgi:hypothetical protein